MQAVLTYVPFAIFGSHWVGGVSGLLAGLVLLVLPRRAGLVAYAALAGLELAAWGWVGLPYEPRLNAGIWVLVAFANQSLVLFGLTRLADLVDALDADRDALAAIEVSGQRLAATRHLRDAVQSRLRRVEADLDAALATADRAPPATWCGPPDGWPGRLPRTPGASSSTLQRSRSRRPAPPRWLQGSRARSPSVSSSCSPCSS